MALPEPHVPTTEELPSLEGTTGANPVSQVAGSPASGTEAFIARYWGKARPGSGPSFHPLAYHQADVAASAMAIAELRPWLLEWMADRLGRTYGWDAAAALRMIVIFAYGHDVGKFAIGFQVQAEHAFQACSGKSPPKSVVPARGDLRHDALGLIAWTRGIPGAPALSQAILGEELDDLDLDAWLPIASAAFGHHGHPTDPEAKGVLSSLPGVMRREDLAAACASCARFRAIIGGFPATAEEAGAREVSVVLAGLLQVADWMGSDRERFPYQSSQVPLSEYWKGALDAARKAVGMLGLVPVKPAPWRGVEAIIPGLAPSPMQRTAAEVVLDGPFLAILEDTMGSGKTEAAIILAARAMAAGLAHGIFVGMPTTATADGQAKRQAALRRALFAKEGPTPSFAVAHGQTDPERWPTNPDGSPVSSDWIADERRLRLLADVCVGTVDQALLGVMASEFSSVRRFALFGKILVIDEVHAFDSYTLRLIEDLVREHAALGGSVILLSATLTGAAKKRLIAAFRAGLGETENGFGEVVSPEAPYPALTLVGTRSAVLIPVDKAPMAPPNKGAERLTEKTIKRHMSALSQFFQFAVDRGHLSVAAKAELTQAHRFRLDRGARDQRDAWTSGDLVALFGSPVWTGCHQVRRAEPGTEIIRDAKFWLPLLALFHGARLEEFADLYRRDIGCDDGTWFVRITEAEGRRLKTANAERVVPLHPEVIRLGFLDYVRATASNPDDPLFPDLEPQGQDRKRGPRITRWFVEYRKAIGVYREGVGMHAFRHTVRTRLSDQITDWQQERHVDFMLGHGRGGSEGRERYDKGPALKAAAETLALLNYPELDLSHLYVRQPDAVAA